MQETQGRQVRSLGQEDPPEKGMATHSSILAWRIPWTEEPGGLQSRGSQSQTRLKQLDHVGEPLLLQHFLQLETTSLEYEAWVEIYLSCPF